MTKYYTFVEPAGPDDFTPVYITMSEEEIISEYWNYWYGQMCKKFGKKFVDTYYSKVDCIEDWVVVHWAWEAEA